MNFLRPNYWQLTALVCCASLGLLGAAAIAADVFQNFDTEPADWIAFHTPEGLTDIGWKGAADLPAEGSNVFPSKPPGEIGGAYTRDAGSPGFSYYATKVGSIDPSTTGFTFKGTLALFAPNFDAWNIGYFTSDDGYNPAPSGFAKNFIGFNSDDRRARPRWAANNNQTGIPALPATKLPQGGAQVEFFFTYDPNGGGGNGHIDAQFKQLSNGTLFPFSVDLPAGLKDQFHNLTDFGLFTRNNYEGTTTERQTFAYFDELTWSVPDPVVPQAGDYNDNGTVDAGDYVVWRKNEDALASLPHDNNLTTQAERYALWQANFGKPNAGSGAALQNSVVPEPSFAAFAVTILGFCYGSTRRMRKN